MSHSSPSDTYSVYGLTLRSALPLPCLGAEHLVAPTDIELLECPCPEILRACSQERVSFREEGFWQCSIFADGSVYVCWREHFEFVVSATARLILWRKLREVSNEVFFTYFLG